MISEIRKRRTFRLFIFEQSKKNKHKNCHCHGFNRKISVDDFPTAIGRSKRLLNHVSFQQTIVHYEFLQKSTEKQ